MEEKKISEGVQAIADFLKKAEEDEVLEKKISEISEADELEIAPKMIRLAAEYGFRFSEADIGHYMSQKRELTADEAEMISGGCNDNTTATGIGKGIGQWIKVKCFAGECMVSVPEGQKSIKDIRIGDKILSLDADGNPRTGTVADVMEPREMPLLLVTFENGNQWLTTDTQWFYCGGDDYSCIKDPGARKAITAQGGTAGVCRVEETDRTELVYDIIVDGLNVFFVNDIAAEGFSLS